MNLRNSQRNSTRMYFKSRPFSTYAQPIPKLSNFLHISKFVRIFNTHITNTAYLMKMYKKNRLFFLNKKRILHLFVKNSVLPSTECLTFIPPHLFHSCLAKARAKLNESKSERLKASKGLYARQMKY